MEIFVYKNGADAIQEGFSVGDLPALLADKTNIVWVDLEVSEGRGINEVEQVLLNVFKFHYLTVEDCLETRNQPKIESFPAYIYFIMHGVKNETNSANFVTKELDGYIGDNFVVTFHTEIFRSIENVKRQVRSTPLAFQRGAAYLLHQILDQLVDLYMPVVDDFDTAINELEDRVFLMKRGTNKLLEEIMDLRRAVARLKRISTRQLDVLYRISHGEFSQIPENVLPYFRDVHDHLLRISDLSEYYRDLVNGLFDIHFAVTANKTNDVMKVLAVFSAIMLPLSLIAGIYGMNFENMPELHSPYGYYATLALMSIIGGGLLIYFWHKGWIFDRNEVESDMIEKVEPRAKKTGIETDVDTV
ncbi:magnesium/cobalt transporter CorA [soil metagenome]